AGPRKGPAEGLLAQAEAEFGKRRFTEARLLYEQANRADEKATAGCGERWAYCKLHHVVEQINNAGPAGCAWPEPEQEGRQALALAPSLGKTGKGLLGGIQTRRRGPAG